MHMTSRRSPQDNKATNLSGLSALLVVPRVRISNRLSLELVKFIKTTTNIEN